jgi:c-di-AMP phosphodiesterase-like protein
MLFGMIMASLIVYFGSFCIVLMLIYFIKSIITGVLLVAYLHVFLCYTYWSCKILYDKYKNKKLSYFINTCAALIGCIPIGIFLYKDINVYSYFYVSGAYLAVILLFSIIFTNRIDNKYFYHIDIDKSEKSK